MVKLSNKKIRWIIKHYHEIGEVSTKEVAEIYNITRRRVQQILKEYREGEIPVLKKNRRISKFQSYLNEQRIKHVVSRKNNPQINGKLERFWLEYDRHRWILIQLMNSSLV